MPPVNISTASAPGPDSFLHVLSSPQMELLLMTKIQNFSLSTPYPSAGPVQAVLQTDPKPDPSPTLHPSLPGLRLHSNFPTKQLLKIN